MEPVVLQSSSLTLPAPPSKKEAVFYYAGLPSRPLLVARTGTIPWKEPRGPEAYLKLKELCAIGNHPLKEAWEGKLALKLHSLLDSMKVKWSSTDVVRIRNVGESSAPIILWIGVIPASLSGNDGVVVAFKCQELLVQYGIADVNVEIRESVVTRSAGPKLLTPADISDPTQVAGVQEPLTTTLGIPICTQCMPCVEGTGGFFIAEDGDTKRLLLVTARHVVFTPDKNENKHFEHMNDSQPHRNVMLFGDVAFNKYLESIKNVIGAKKFHARYQDECISEGTRRDDLEANKEFERAQANLDKVRGTIKELDAFYQDVLTNWATPESRVLGHVILSPSISVGVGGSTIEAEGYTEDWAIIEIDASKINTSNFDGNTIDLQVGPLVSAIKFIHMMRPNPNSKFACPDDTLLKLKGTIPDEEMRHPTTLDQNNEPCLMVLKRGNTTGLTVGRANTIFSYVRYYDDDKAATSKEWAILPFDSKSCKFSDKGDSGSVIVDGLGRIGGLLTSGAGSADGSDITYATPISFLLKRMQENGLRVQQTSL
ncbi:hypothetical protein OG21DRAFT_956385 [Imleria badia]|nr:hypothetical protein OG21DRAFT_956385 [Imleria badia]